MHGDFLKKHECETADKAIQRQYGCLEKSQTPYRILEYEFDRCPNHYLKESSWVTELVEMWNWREKGFLPLNTSWMNHPNFMVEAIGFMDYLMSVKQESEMKKSNKNG